MPDDFRERIEFLLKDSGSLHANLQELHARVADNARHIEALTQRADRNEQRWEKLGRAIAAGLQEWLNDNDESNNGEGR